MFRGDLLAVYLMLRLIESASALTADALKAVEQTSLLEYREINPLANRPIELWQFAIRRQMEYLHP